MLLAAAAIYFGGGRHEDSNRGRSGWDSHRRDGARATPGGKCEWQAAPEHQRRAAARRTGIQQDHGGSTGKRIRPEGARRESETAARSGKRRAQAGRVSVESSLKRRRRL